MESTQATRKKLLFEIEQLSNPYLVELQNFVQYLKFKQSNKVILPNGGRILPPEKDPILRSIGIFDVAPFSDAVMQELGISDILTGDAHFTHVGMGFVLLP